MRVVALLLFTLNLQAQVLYLLPGQGADRRLFDSLKFTPNYTLQVIEYGCPQAQQNMQEFAKTLLSQIDTTQAFSLIGTSLGGMLCVELAELCRPQKTIIISSAKNRNELPLRYKFQYFCPLYKLVPAALLKMGALALQPLVEPDSKRHKSVFTSMLRAKSRQYMKRSIGLIMNLQRTENTAEIVHIHGSKDHTIPYKNLKKVQYTVKGGSHMMTLTRGREISNIILQLLNH